MAVIWIIGGMAAAVGVPLWIHLRAGREPEDWPWAAMQFLRQAFEARRRWLRLRRWVLMLLRMALIALLVLAMARVRLPLNPQWPLLDGAALRIVLVLDDTASLAARDRETGQACFERLRQRALKTVDRYPTASFAIVFVSKSQSGQWLTSGAARSVLENAKVTAMGGSLPQSLAAAQATLAQRQAADVVFVFSDHQQTAWPTRDATAPASLARLSAAARIGMFGLEGQVPDNAGIADLAAEPYPAVVGKECILRARLTTSGQVRQQAVDLYVDDRFVATQVVSPREGGKAAVAVFRQTFDSPGVHRIEARLPGDEMTADDSRCLVLDVARDANVLCVTNPGDDLSIAFVRALIASAQPCPFSFPANGFSADCWPEETAALITANLTAVPPEHQKKLQRFLQRGGIWLCFLGPGVDTAAYQRLAAGGLLPVELGEMYGPETGDRRSNEYFQIDSLRIAHPIFDCGESFEFRQAMFGEPRFTRAFDIRPLAPVAGDAADPPETPTETDDPRGSSRVIAWFNNGRNFIIECRLGKGMVYVFASTADLRWNNLPLTPAFVLVDKSLHHLLESSRPLRQRVVGEPLAAERPGPDWRGELLLPDGSRRPSLNQEDDQATTSRWTTTEQSGFYLVQFRRNLLRQRPQQLAVWYAFNTQADESDLERIDWEEIRRRYPDFEFACDQDRQTPYELVDRIRRGGSMAEASRLLAMLALIVLVAESWLASGVRRT